MSLVVLMAYLEQEITNDPELQQLLQLVTEEIKENQRLSEQDKQLKLLHAQMLAEVEEEEALLDQVDDEHKQYEEVLEESRETYSSSLQLQKQLEELDIDGLIECRMNQQVEKMKIEVEKIEKEMDEKEEMYRAMEQRVIVQKLRDAQRRERAAAEHVEEVRAEANEKRRKAYEEVEAAEQLRNKLIVELILEGKRQNAPEQPPAGNDHSMITGSSQPGDSNKTKTTGAPTESNAKVSSFSKFMEMFASKQSELKINESVLHSMPQSLLKSSVFKLPEVGRQAKLQSDMVVCPLPDPVGQILPKSALREPPRAGSTLSKTAVEPVSKPLVEFPPKSALQHPLRRVRAATSTKTVEPLPELLVQPPPKSALQVQPRVWSALNKTLNRTAHSTKHVSFALSDTEDRNYTCSGPPEPMSFDEPASATPSEKVIDVDAANEASGTGEESDSSAGSVTPSQSGTNSECEEPTTSKPSMLTNPSGTIECPPTEDSTRMPPPQQSTSRTGTKSRSNLNEMLMYMLNEASDEDSIVSLHSPDSQQNVKSADTANPVTADKSHNKDKSNNNQAKYGESEILSFGDPEDDDDGFTFLSEFGQTSRHPTDNNYL